MTSDLFKQIETVIPKLAGWCSCERACDIAAVILASRPSNITVIGVFGGRDLVAAALACKYVGRGAVVGIDPWSAAHSVDGQQGADAEWWSSQDMHENVYQSFLASLAEHGLTEPTVAIRRAPSDDVQPESEIGLLISDGNHGPQSIRDIERFAPNVCLGGFAYLDDIGWSGGAVMKSVEKLLALGFRELYRRDGGAWFQRISA